MIYLYLFILFFPSVHPSDKDEAAVYDGESGGTQYIISQKRDLNNIKIENFYGASCTKFSYPLDFLFAASYNR